MEKPKCQLVGIDGNVYNIIATVSNCLKRAGQKEQAKEFEERAFKAESYNAVLVLCLEYVDVEDEEEDEEDDFFF